MVKSRGKEVARCSIRNTRRDSLSIHTAPSYAGLYRSEEHTSELQSPCNVVFRLLLENKQPVEILVVGNPVGGGLAGVVGPRWTRPLARADARVAHRPALVFFSLSAVDDEELLPSPEQDPPPR